MAATMANLVDVPLGAGRSCGRLNGCLVLCLHQARGFNLDVLQSYGADKPRRWACLELRPRI